MRVKNKNRWINSTNFYDSREWHYIRRRAMEYADYRCQEPGCTERDSLQAHHIRPRMFYPELAFELSNLEVLCPIHHQGKHKHSLGFSKFTHAQAANNDQYVLDLEFIDTYE